MSQVLYRNWKEELEAKYQEHRKLLGYNTIGGIGVTGYIKIQLSELEEQIKELEAKIKNYEAGDKPLESQLEVPIKDAEVKIKKHEEADEPKVGVVSPESVSKPIVHQNLMPEIMEKYSKPIMFLAGISLFLYFLSGSKGEWEFAGIKLKNPFSQTAEKVTPPSLTPSPDTATILGTILTNDSYLKSRKISRIYLSTEILNEGTVNARGIFTIRNSPIPPDKLIQLVVDFDDDKRGESTAINLSYTKKNINGVYQIEQPINIRSNALDKSSSRPVNNRPASPPSNSGVTIVFNPHLEQNVILPPQDTTKK